ncbi:MAG: signal recognition particle-docking protein FtsY [Deltaproteobacteria bacterium]|nr:signal recognition particle-docking protein FtsY [Deltaproteobacteria bacterium]
MIKWFKRSKAEDQGIEESALDREDDNHTVIKEHTVETSESGVTRVEAHEGPLTSLVKEASPSESKKKSFVSRLKERLVETRAVLTTRVDHLVLGVKEINDDVLDDLEEILITSDLGVQTTQTLIKAISDKVARRELSSPERLKDVLREEILKILSLPQHEPDKGVHPYVILVAGVNGVGKTTTIAKLAHRFISQDQKVMLVAADTFRAAAIEQLQIWSERVGAELIKQQSGADPSAVVFDALHAAKARATDIVIIDTAGRLHTKVNLMEELKKIKRIADREMPGAPHEILLVLDATTGQNAISQAKLFNEAVEVTHLAMTKLDGTAKGGILVAIACEFGLPIRYIGLGEKMDDLKDFEAASFIQALFD